MKLSDSVLSNEPDLSTLNLFTNNLPNESTVFNWILRYPKHIPQLPHSLTYLRPINLATQATSETYSLLLE